MVSVDVLFFPFRLVLLSSCSNSASDGYRVTTLPVRLSIDHARSLLSSITVGILSDLLNSSQFIKGISYLNNLCQVRILSLSKDGDQD